MSDAENNNAGGLTRRSFLTNTAATLVGLTLGAKAAGRQTSSKTYGFINGYWFDGQNFESETPAATIFPKRKIGLLKNGYEASFLVLNDNPLQDFANVQKIDKRFKQGEFLSL